MTGNLALDILIFVVGWIAFGALTAFLAGILDSFVGESGFPLELCALGPLGLLVFLFGVSIVSLGMTAVVLRELRPNASFFKKIYDLGNRK